MHWKVKEWKSYLFQRRQTLTSTLGLLGLSRSRKYNTLSSSSVIVKTLLHGNSALVILDVMVPVPDHVPVLVKLLSN
jgi:hypothetical protein